MLTKNWLEDLIAFVEYALQNQQSLLPFLDFVQESFSLLTEETPETEVAILQGYAGRYNWTPTAEDRNIKISVRTTENKPGYLLDITIRDNQVLRVDVFTEYHFVDEENNEEYSVKTKTELHVQEKTENQYFEVIKTNTDSLLNISFLNEALDLISSTVFKIDTINYSSFFDNYLNSLRNHPRFVKSSGKETDNYFFDINCFITADKKHKKAVVSFKAKS